MALTLQKFAPWLAALVLFLAVLGGGYYIRSIKAERDALRVQVATQKATIDAQALQKERDDLTLKAAQKAAQAAASQAADARAKLRQASPAWRAQALPADVQEALK